MIPPGTHASHLINEDISIVEDTWIAICGEVALWLHHEYRSVHSAIQNNNLVLGHPSGRILFLGLSCSVNQEAAGL
jgi:hypothetical protein